MSHNPLGPCQLSVTPDGSMKCGGQLEISGDEIRCISCGGPQRGHPEQLRINAFKAAEKARPPQRVELRPEDNEGHRQFMQARNAQKAIQQLQDQVAGLSERLAKLEKVQARPVRQGA